MLNIGETKFIISINKNIIYFLFIILYSLTTFVVIDQMFDSLHLKLDDFQDQLKSLTAVQQELNNMDLNSKTPLLGDKLDSPKMSEEFKTFLIRAGFLCVGGIVLCVAFFYLSSSLNNSILLINSCFSSTVKYLQSFFYEETLTSNQSVDFLGNILKHETDIKTGNIQYYIKPVNKTDFESFSQFLAEHPHFAEKNAQDFDNFASSYISCAEKLNIGLVENTNSVDIGISIADAATSCF